MACHSKLGSHVGNSRYLLGQTDMMKHKVDLSIIEVSDFLSKIDIMPNSKEGGKFIYFSPFRNEKVPSFFVFTESNRWYDFGISGNEDWTLIGFIKLFYNKTKFKECLDIIAEAMELPSKDIKCPVKAERKCLEIIEEQPISNDKVKQYIKSRKADIITAKRYIKEIKFKYFNQVKLGISYDNNAGGKEIVFLNGMKSCCKNKSFTLIKGRSGVSMFEGMMDFLSFLKLVNKRSITRSVIILNSVNNINQAMKIISPEEHIRCYLDRDIAGFDCFELINKRFDCTDHAEEYEGFKDVNDLLKGIS